jgi:nucleotide-binding universal stress UspA family protein
MSPAAKSPRRILVPIDGSACALRALDHAIDQARVAPAEIHLLNVEAPLDHYGMVPAYLSKRAHREATSRRAKSLLAPAVDRVEAARIPFAVHVAWGEPGEAIVAAARRQRCGRIVMGTRGMGATRNLLLGSVANKVVHGAKVPVTLVK